MMPKSTQPKWPKLLFTFTVLLAVGFAILLMVYYYRTAKLQRQTSLIETKRTALQATITELQSKRQVQKIVQVVVPVPVTSSVCSNIGPFGTRICVPHLGLQMREESQVVLLDDPVVKAQIDKAYADLKALSDEAISTASKRDSAEGAVTIAREAMAPGLSIAIALASLYIILSKKYSAESEKWAFGSIGTILGFWLK
jgi:hypothetical protein